MAMKNDSTCFKLTFEQLSAFLPEDAFDVDLKTDLSVVVGAMNNDKMDNATGEHNIVMNLSTIFNTTSSIKNPLETLKMIRYWALEFLKEEETNPSFPTGLMDSPDPTSAEKNDSSKKSYSRTIRSITAKQARGLLSNVFFANCCDPMSQHKERWNQGGLDWRPLLRGVGNQQGGSSNGIGIERMRCHLLYFDAAATAASTTKISYEKTDDDTRRIVFERIRYQPRQFLSETNFNGDDSNSDTSSSSIVGKGVVLHNSPMENPTRVCQGFVNFANPNFGYGKFIRSCTQEEILESCCPEFTIGLLWIGLMKPDEVVIVRNVKRFAKYTGYLNSFRCQGPLSEEDGICAIQDILTLDACYKDHFSVESIERDINKAYFSFQAFCDMVDDHKQSRKKQNSKTGAMVVSTGKWGCGAFGGTAPHKFVQQVFAASIAGVDLDFSVFGQPEGCDTILKAIREYKPSVRDVSKALSICRKRNTFVKDFVSEIRSKGETGETRKKRKGRQKTGEDLV